MNRLNLKLSQVIVRKRSNQFDTGQMLRWFSTWRKFSKIDLKVK